jgi:hypothetical protein
VTPYTYLIGWSTQHKYYYGVRYAKGCHPSELWETYRTSSRYVKEFAERYGDPDVIQIRKTFTNINSARHWERRVLRRINAVYRDDFLNRTDNIAILADPQKLSEALKGKKKSDAHCNAMSIAAKRSIEIYGPRRNKCPDRIKKLVIERNKLQTGRNNPRWLGVIITPYGQFDTLKEAGKASGHCASWILRMFKNSPEQYYRVTIGGEH